MTRTARKMRVAAAVMAVHGATVAVAVAVAISRFLNDLVKFRNRGGALELRLIISGQNGSSRFLNDLVKFRNRGGALELRLIISGQK